MENKRRQLLLGIGMILIALFMFVGIVHLFFKYNHSCLEDVAIRVCQEKSLYYYSFYSGNQDVFYGIGCKEDLRNISYIQLEFLDEELRGCRK